MPKRQWQIFISPVHIVQLKADHMELVAGGVLEFRRDDAVIAQFNQFMGWIELLEDPKDAATVTPLTIVPRGDPAPTPPPGAA